MVEAPTRQRPGSAPVPPQGAPGSLGWLGAPRREASPVDSQPLPSTSRGLCTVVVRIRGAGQPAPGAVRLPASGVPYVPRTVAPQVTSHQEGGIKKNSDPNPNPNPNLSLTLTRRPSTRRVPVVSVASRGLRRTRSDEPATGW